VCPSPSTSNVPSSSRVIKIFLRQQTFRMHPLYMVMPFPLIFLYLFHHSFCYYLFSYICTSCSLSQWDT
jgi:hypothetical protein